MVNDLQEEAWKIDIGFDFNKKSLLIGKGGQGHVYGEDSGRYAIKEVGCMHADLVPSPSLNQCWLRGSLVVQSSDTSPLPSLPCAELEIIKIAY